MSAAVRRIAVVGPGLMGLGIAQVAAATGLQVVLMGTTAHRRRPATRAWSHSSSGK